MPFDRDVDHKWQPPTYDAKPGQKIGWVNDVVSAGEGASINRPVIQEMQLGINMISGKAEKRISESRSRLVINQAKRSLREVNANISDIRCVDGFSSDNPAYADEVTMRNKIWRAIYYEGRYRDAFKKAVQWMSVGGYSYISPVYRSTRMTDRHKRSIQFDVFPATECLPFQLPQNNAVQGAYAWTIFRFMPEFEAHAKFPRFQHLLRPIARRRYSGNPAKDRLTFAERFRNSGDWSTPSVGWADMMNEIRYTYINDLSINTSDHPIGMGRPGSIASYVVPFIGQNIPTPFVSSKGKRQTKKAEEDDCYLYPNLRLIISQKGMDRDMYDGPAFDQHGMFPLARFSADEWPWEPGYSLAREIYSIQEARANLQRGADQTSKARYDPSLLYDKDKVNKKTAESFDPYEERGRLGIEGGITDATVRTALPENILNIPSWHFDLLNNYDETSEHLLGNDAMNNLAKAKVAMSADAVEKALEEAGPIVKDICYSSETPTEDIMQMSMNIFYMNYPVGRTMQYLGADGVTKPTFDLDASSMVPSHAPNEDKSLGDSIYTKAERVKIWLNNTPLMIAPGAQQNIVQTEQKLMLMQGFRAGLPLDPITIMKSALNIQNPQQEVEGFFKFKKRLVEEAVAVQELQQSLMPPPPAPPGQPGAFGGAPSVGTGPTPQPGRPPSGNKPPTAETKASAEGPRLVVAES